MRSKKYYIAINENERRIIINALNALRNKLLAEGRYSDAVDELLIDIVTAPIKKYKIKFAEGQDYGEKSI